MNRIVASLRPALRTASRGSYGFVQARFFSGSTFLDRNEVVERVISVVKSFDKVDATKVTEASAFTADLGLDSLDAVEVQMALETEFCVEIPDAEADKILSCADAIAFISSHPQAK